MRVRLWNRFIIAFTGLLLLAAGVLAALCALNYVPAWLNLSELVGGLVTWQRVVVGGVALVLCLLGLHNICMLFARKNTKGFITQRTDYGNMSISMKALDTMARKCINQHQELEIKSTRIYRVKNGIAVRIRLLLETGVNIPLTVSALQKQIKQYIVSCSGVDVHEVQVLVETNQPKPKKPHEQQQEIVVDNRQPDIVPEPVELQREVPAEETAPVAETAEEFVEEAVEEHAETAEEPADENEAEPKLIVERKVEDIAEENPEAAEDICETVEEAGEAVEETIEEAAEETAEEDFFAGFDAFAADTANEEIPAEENKEDME